MGRVWPIQYSPAVVDAINDVHRSGLAEVRWLTTWEQDAHRSLAPAVGLDPFTAYDIPDDCPPGTWCKSEVVVRSITEESRPFVWTDDDLDEKLLDDRVFAHLLISPTPSVGLARHDLDQITAFLSDIGEAGAR